MLTGQPVTVEIYETREGVRPLEDWLAGLRDRQARARIRVRLDRLAEGNPGDYKSVGEGVTELRIGYGPGYRVYFASRGDQFVLLLCGGDKTTQPADIANAKKYWADYQQRSEV